MLSLIINMFSRSSTEELQHKFTLVTEDIKKAAANELDDIIDSPTYIINDKDDQLEDDFTCDDDVKNESNAVKADQKVKTLPLTQDVEILNPPTEVEKSRSILCTILSTKENGCCVQIDDERVDISYDDVQIEFVPYKDDNVLMMHSIKIVVNDFGEETETIHPESIIPWGLRKQQRYIVREVNKCGGMLNDNIGFLHDYLIERKQLCVGDIVYADIITSQSVICKYRAIRIQLESEVKNKPVEPLSDVDDANKSDREHSPEQNNCQKESSEQSSNQNFQVVTISPDQRIDISTSFLRKLVTFTMRSNVPHKIFVRSILIDIPRGPVRVYLYDQKLGNGFILPPKEEVQLIFWVSGNTPCSRRVTITFNFTKFAIKRSIMVNIGSCTGIYFNDDAPTAIQSNIEMPAEMRDRAYANTVWMAASKYDIAPSYNPNRNRRFVHEHIGRFEVPQHLRHTYLLVASQDTMIEDIDNLMPCLTRPLIMANYAERFDALLYLEEIELFVALRSLDMCQAHFRPAGEYLALDIENLAERRPSLCIGDTVRASRIGTKLPDKNSPPQDVFEGLICKVLSDHMLIRFGNGFHQTYGGESYRLEFFFSRFPFRKQHHAVHRAVKCLGKTFLFPTKLQLRSKLQLRVCLNTQGGLLVDDVVRKWYNSDLNIIQKMAVRNILRGEVLGMPHIVFGPPGTGKTSTLVETALQLVALMPHSNLLIGTPSNSTADLILVRLVASKMLSSQAVVRLVSHNYIEKEVLPEHLLPFCATVDVGISGSCDNEMTVLESGLRLNCSTDNLRKCRIIIGTCSTIGTMMQMDFGRKHLTHVLIDEAGQCIEPDALQVITQCSQECGQVVLFGDPRQLQGLVQNKIARCRGLDLSLLERLLNDPPYRNEYNNATAETCGYDERLVTKLLYNYRSHPTILDVFNKLFYEGELRPIIDAETSREANALRALQAILPGAEAGGRPPTHGACFFGLKSRTEKSDDSPSWFNSIEAQQIFVFTLSLYEKGVEAKDIGIITPYAKQVKFLRNLFNSGEVNVPKIGSVEDFLGQERDIILISTVRADITARDPLRFSLGFLQCPKRINVLISRARYLLCVFGNPHALVQDPHWRYYIRYCVNNKAYTGINLPLHMLADDGYDIIA